MDIPGSKSLVAFIVSLIILFLMSEFSPDTTTTAKAMEIISVIVPAYLIYRSGQDKKNGSNGNDSINNNNNNNNSSSSDLPPTM